MTLTTTTTMKSQARQLTSRVTMVPRKLKKQPKKKIPSFSDALLLLCSPDYSLVDAYPTLCRVYAIAVAIPVSSSTTERSFSALKRVKLAFARPWFRKDLNRYFQCQSSVKFCLPLFFPFLAGGWGASIMITLRGAKFNTGPAWKFRATTPLHGNLIFSDQNDVDNFVDGYSENNVAEIQVFYIVEINLPNRGHHCPYYKNCQSSLSWLTALTKCALKSLIKMAI